MATNETYIPGQLYLIALSELLPDPDQPRKYLDSAALTSSISKTLSINKLPLEVLDDCRKDPTIPKSALIDIAQKKQARSMVTAYQKYKAGLNPQKKTATGARLSVAQNACNIVDKTGQKISGLDVTGLTHDERDSFANALDALKQIIESKFQAMAQ